jgi:Flp pilus assembly protein TadG
VTVERHYRRRSRGQALVEFALGSVLLAVLFCGTGQVGAIVFTQLNVDNASRDAARIASLEPDTSGAYTAGVPQAAFTCPASTSGSTNPVCVAAWNADGGGASGLTVTIAPASTGPQGTCFTTNQKANTLDGFVSVKVVTHAPIFVPFVDSIFANPQGSGTRTLTSITVMRITTCSITNGT